MVPDSNPHPRVPLPRETVELLERTLADYARGRPDDGTLRAVLRRLSDEARALGAAAEDVLIHLKQAWEAIPGAESHAAAEERARRLQAAVTMCIKEYFR